MARYTAHGQSTIAMALRRVPAGITACSVAQLVWWGIVRFQIYGTRPQAHNITGEVLRTITFDVTIYNGDQVAQTIPMTSVLTGKTLEAGKSYNLTANLTADKLGLKKIDFTVLVNDWVPETNDIEI